MHFCSYFHLYDKNFYDLIRLEKLLLLCSLVRTMSPLLLLLLSYLVFSFCHLLPPLLSPSPCFHSSVFSQLFSSAKYHHHQYHHHFLRESILLILSFFILFLPLILPVSLCLVILLCFLSLASFPSHSIVSCRT